MGYKLQGRVIVVGENIDTDQIYPGRYLELVDPQEIAKHAMEGAIPDFHLQFKKGDIIVADRNFGCGSSREHAVITLKTAGVTAIVAPSFARIFYRNAINLGLPLITCKDITKLVKAGDEISIDLKAGLIENLAEGKEIKGDELPQFVLDMISEGGIKAYYINQNR